jgi:cell cycle arrest protein BUB3
LYDIESNQLKHSYTHTGPVLDCYLADEYHSYSGCYDGQLKSYDFSAQKELVLGSHSDAIRCVLYNEKCNLVITGSWDKTIKLWDPRRAACVGVFEQPGKVYTMDKIDEKLIVGTDERKIMIWNLNNMRTDAAEQRESNLKYQLRSIRCSPDRKSFVCTSIEGRASVDYFDMSQHVQENRYVFKCHRHKENGFDIIYPVSALAFNTKYNTFATGGADWLAFSLVFEDFFYSNSELLIFSLKCGQFLGSD